MPEDEQKAEIDAADEGNSEDSETEAVETEEDAAVETDGAADAEEEAGADAEVDAETDGEAADAAVSSVEADEDETNESEGSPDDGGAVTGDSDDKPPKGADEVYCSSCGAVIKEQAEVCPECGVRQQSASAAQEKNPILAAVLSFIIPGAGQIYNGQIARGAVFLVVFFINILLAFVLIGVFTQLITVVIAVYDAYNQAQKINAGEVQV